MTNSIVFAPNGTEVARGQHTVPNGIAVFQFADGDQEQLCTPPDDVLVLLENSNRTDVYQKFAKKFSRQYITQESRSFWMECQLVEVVQSFQKDFIDAQIRLALCLLNSDYGNYRWFWLEFIDARVIPDTYTPKYNVTDHRLVLNNHYMIPPTGIEVHNLSDWDSTKFLEIPHPVKALLEPKGLLPAYQELIQTIHASKTTRNWAGSWKTTDILPIVKQHRDAFRDRGIQLVVCKRTIPQEAEMEIVEKWIEIIDTSLEHSYTPLFSVDADDSRNSEERSWMRFSALKSKLAASLIVVQYLVVDNEPTLSATCPSDVKLLLERKGLKEEFYSQLGEAITASKSLRNFVDLWRLTELGLVAFPCIEDFKSNLLKGGVRTVLCESVGPVGRNYWLEYVDVAGTSNYSSPFDVALPNGKHQLFLEEAKTYTKVIGGRHSVPKGVQVEELNDKDKKSLLICPPNVQELLEPMGLMAVYDKCMTAIAKSKNTMRWDGGWSANNIANVLKDFEEEFGSQGVKVVVCKLKPATGTSFRWFEFIDTAVANDYVPQYDVSNMDEELETAGSKVQFPAGVVVEKLTDSKRLMEHTSPSVKALMTKKGCLDLYNALVDVICMTILNEDKDDESGGGGGDRKFNMKEVINVLGPKFEAKGVSVFLSSRPEPGGEKASIWVEFVDRALQPNYVAQFGIDMKMLAGEALTLSEELRLASAVLLPLLGETLIEALLYG